MGELLKGRNILIMGVRNKWSIAWGIAEACHREGANLIFSYMGDREKEALDKLIVDMGQPLTFPCNVTDDAEIESMFQSIGEKVGTLHGLVHAIAFAKSEDLSNGFINTSREGFKTALEVSAYSYIAVARPAAKLMTEGGSMMTLTYYGADRVCPGYDVMGVAKAALEATTRYLAYDLGPANIRVNAISAGPIKTMSAKGVKSFGDILSLVEERSPLRRNVTLQDLGNNAVYLLGDLSSGVSGEIIYVDSGYNVMGV